MKNVKSRILLVFLSCLILFNSSGFGLIEHSCSMRGKKSYSFVVKDACKGCDKHKKNNAGQASISKTKCCDDKQADKTENISESIVNITAKFVKSITQAIAKAFVWVATILAETVIDLISHNNQESSTLFGKSLLIFISVFRL